MNASLLMNAPPLRICLAAAIAGQMPPAYTDYEIRATPGRVTRPTTAPVIKTVL